MLIGKSRNTLYSLLNFSVNLRLLQKAFYSLKINNQEYKWTNKQSQHKYKLNMGLNFVGPFRCEFFKINM